MKNRHHVRGQLDVVRREPRVIELANEGYLSEHIADELSLPNWAVQSRLEELGLFRSWREIEKMCAHCGDVYLPKMSRQQFCRVCIPHGGANSRMKAYGVSQPEVDALLDRQDDKCAICKRDVSSLRGITIGVGSGRIDAGLDHDHVSGAIRGVLCKKCNLVLAYIDKPDWLRSALEYVTREPPCDIIVGDAL